MGSCMGCVPLNGHDRRERNAAASVERPPSLNHAPSVAAASVLVSKIDPGLNLSHRACSIVQAHLGPLAMAALVHGVAACKDRIAAPERGQGALHIALIELPPVARKAASAGAERQAAYA